MIRKKLKIASESKSNAVVGDNKIECLNEIADVDSDGVAITSQHFQMPYWQRLYQIECRLSAELKTIDFHSKNIAAVYNPIEYAANLHCDFLQKYLNGPKSVLFVGMNPGPYGMVQTGVPFGYIPVVRDWLKISGTVNKPEEELTARPVQGLDCTKNEQSGQRFWSLIQDVCSDLPANFFANCFIHNFCPLAFFQSSGRNITPAEIKPDLRKQLQNICLKYMNETIELLSPAVIVSIGRYTEDRINELYKQNRVNVSIVHKCMPHPSPRSLNNTNWNEKAKKWLIENDLMRYFNYHQN